MEEQLNGIKYKLFENDKKKLDFCYEKKLHELYKKNLAILKRKDKKNMKKTEKNMRDSTLVVGTTK